MPVRVSRLVLAVLLGALALLGAAPAAQAAPAGPALAQSRVLAQPTTTAPDGPALDPAQTEAEAEKSRKKLVIGISAIVLLAIVVYGNRVRAKRRKG